MRPLHLLLVIVCPLVAVGQSGPRYNLKSVHVELMDGRTVTGKWITASADTLVMEGRALGGIKLTPGSEVSFRLKGAGRDYQGKLAGVTDTTLLVILAEQRDTTFVVNRTYVTHLEVTHAAYVATRNKGRRLSIPVTEIRSIRVHPRGSGTLGFVTGLIIGTVITAAIISEAPFSSGEGAAIPMLVTPLLGIGLATIGGKHPIMGSHENFEAFVQKARAPHGNTSSSMK